MASDDVTGKQNLPDTLHSTPEKAVTPSADTVEKFTETVGEAMAKYSDKIMLRSSESEENNADGANVILTLLQKLENSCDSFKEGPEKMLTKYHEYFFDSETYLFTGQIKEIPLAHSAGISIETMKKDAPECSKKSTSRSPESEKENNNGGGGEAGKTNKTVKFPSIETSRSDVFPKLQALKTSPSVGVNLESYEASNTSPGMKSTAANQVISESGAVGNGGGSLMVDEAWESLKKSYVFFNGNPVGTLAALDPSVEALNYNQV
ncbi:hypothetical protein Nepgr_024383 [Nepenthes gracilis]|uniref:Alkaline/neutral invertase n=1 Tax=Nepenthes gracilis TaxID=150966 RepID=A0AAD3T458_NEPGR|nr:hypothetical protein Nepgr_024383 [Nepenthes gracilis]